MELSDLNGGRTNPMTGYVRGIGFFSAEQIPFAVVIIFIAFVSFFFWPGNGTIKAIQAILLFIFLFFSFWFLTGNDPRGWFSRLTEQKRWISVEPETKRDSAGILHPEPIKRRVEVYKTSDGTSRYHVVQKEFKLLTYAQKEDNDSYVGFYILKRGYRLMFIFAWEITQAHDPSMTTERALEQIEASANAINTMSLDIGLKVVSQVRSDATEYLRQQAEIYANEDLDNFSRALVKSRALRAKELANEGLFLQNRIFYFCKYALNIGTTDTVAQTFLDKTLGALQPVITWANGGSNEDKDAWEKVIDTAYQVAYRSINMTLTDQNNFAFSTRTLSVQDLWDRDYAVLHKKKSEIPGYVRIVNGRLVEPSINSAQHAIGRLFAPEDGIPVIPQFYRNYIYLPHSNKYAAFLRFDHLSVMAKHNNSLPIGIKRYLYNISASQSEAHPLRDFDCVVEFRSDNPKYTEIQAERTATAAMNSIATSERKNRPNVTAENRYKEAKAVLQQLAANQNPTWISGGIWMYRNSPEELDVAIQGLTTKISGMEVEREEYDTQGVFWSSFPFEWEFFLYRAAKPRQKYFAYEAQSLVPQVKVPEADKRGALLLSRESLTPLYLDIANRKNHLGIFAMSESGKSVFMAELFLEVLLAGYLVLGFDFTPIDKGSTFKELTTTFSRVGFSAAYHNVRQKCMNLMEMPDLRHIPPDSPEYKETYEKIIEDQYKLLMAIVLEGSTRDPGLVGSLLSQCQKAFHQEVDIIRRYEAAWDGGFCSLGHKNGPILEDFVEFTCAWLQRYKAEITEQDMGGDITSGAIERITTQLRGILTKPIGDRINGPSDFDTSVQFLIIALTDSDESVDSLIYALSGMNLLKRKAVTARRSVLPVDESTTLLSSDYFSQQISEVPVQGRHWGCNLILSGQEMESVINCPSGAKIMNNLDNIFCGRILDDALARLSDPKVGFRHEILKKFASNKMRPDPHLRCSNWYWKRNDKHIEVRHFVSDLLLATTASNEDEEEARNRVLKHFPNNRVEGLIEFSKHYIRCKKQNIPLSTIYPETTEDTCYAA